MAATASARAPGRPTRQSRRREILTPEGVPLPVTLAGRGERAIAVLIDLTIIFGILFVVSVSLLVGVGAGVTAASGWALALVLLISFAVRSFYFIIFELRWQGRTPGKRVLGLRVVDRAGGRLRSDAVFARNLMREVELFIPLTLLAADERVGSETWVVLLTLVWLSIFALMPFFNSDRLRAGDIVGGTWVILAPKVMLLADLAGSAAGQLSAASGFRFTRKQLEVYGIYELQTLENVLRQSDPNARARQDAVRRQIQRKISWTEAKNADPRPFLEAFYAALRAHLETKMLLGVRRKDKHDRR